MVKVGFFVVESMFALFSLKIKGAWLQTYIILNMLMIPIFGARSIEVFGLISNVGNIFFAFAMLGFALLIIREGREVTCHTYNRVFFAFILFFIVTALLEHIPIVPGNEGVVEAQARLFKFSSSIIVASFAAMLIALSSFIFLYEKYGKKHPIWAYAILTPIIQAVDSFIFFPIAFYRSEQDIWSLAVDGTIIKIGISLLTTPLVFFAINKMRK